MAIALALVPAAAVAQSETSFAANRGPAVRNADGETCAAFVRSGLADPGSYVPKTVRREDAAINVEDYLEWLGEVGSHEAIRDVITADAAAFGLQLRTLTINGTSRVNGSERPRSDTCQFELYGGKVADQIELSRRLDALLSRRKTPTILARRGEPGMVEALEAMTCCLLD